VTPGASGALTAVPDVIVVTGSGGMGTAVARRLGMAQVDFSDPRSPLEKTAHRLLASTQHRRSAWTVRGLERLLRAFGW